MSVTFYNLITIRIMQSVDLLQNLQLHIKHVSSGAYFLLPRVLREEILDIAQGIHIEDNAVPSSQ